MFRRHPVLSVFTLLYLGVVGWVTLGPQPLNSSDDGWLWRILSFFGDHTLTSWIDYNDIEFAANIAMFFPIGLFFLLLFGRRLWWLAIVGGIVLTVGIETAQIYIPGRVSDIRDIESNSIGAILGVLIGLVLTASKARRIRTQRRQPLAQR